ncbi:Na+/H+ antiporter NhaC family protein [Sansalvadorimonas verongulae]|uniref:Na+/H+ antiporter NhaC family protein n=1 Tax=Sansalvadorimonas verongulae TaxID=2172824 RepID=UPI0012BC5BE5|nr:Na+/H+ antiporter NhaC family protein [Sansalvadorimonas verongulae]MTI13693.1 Na+/H+ antiporter NhaC family protein [Sansalvadorimonas verongulae]
MNDTPPANGLAMLPLFVFVVIFFGGGVYHSIMGTEFAFYQIKAPVAALPAMVVAVILASGAIEDRIHPFLKGVADINIATMCMVFLLAGAFSQVTSAIGGVDATVALGLQMLPGPFLLPGLFMVSAFVATAMGTSMGTVAAIAPVAVGIADSTDLSLGVCVGAVVGGAMFGDNLSMISDTTIAATRTQGCNMRDKLMFNIRIALPAAVVTLILLLYLGQGGETVTHEADNPWLVLPYILVLGLAVSGMNVLVVLMSGILFSTLMGMVFGEYSLATAGDEVYRGFESMIEIMVLSMFIGGLSRMMTENGGKAWLIGAIRRMFTRKGELTARSAELGIAVIVSICNVFTANNTVAILASGELARDLSQETGIDPRRSASLLDIFSCVIQGLIPWGAQILLAGSIAGISPLFIAGAVHYVWVLAIVALLAIVTGFPRIIKAPPFH